MGYAGIKIEVTPEDIRRAIIADSYKCVVSQAIARTIPDATNIEVDIQTVRFTRQTTKNRYVYLTPYTVQGYIVAFDAGDSIEPFIFTLRNPQIVKPRKQAQPQKLPIKSDTLSREDLPSVPIQRENLPPTTVEQIRDLKGDDIDVLTSYNEAKAAALRTNNKIPPKVFKSKKRMYGLRVLRYNQNKIDE